MSNAMIRVTKRVTFEAAHFLEGYEGLCQYIHGHHYIVEVTVGPAVHDDVLRNQGMLIDFSLLKRVLNMLVDEWDHAIIVENEVACLGGLTDRMVVLSQRPTAENMAAYFLQRCQSILEDAHILVDNVRVYETPDSWADASRS